MKLKSEKDQRIIELTKKIVALERNVKTLKKSNEELRIVFENAQEAIAVILDETIMYCNPQITELSGYSTVEIYSKRFTELVHPDNIEMLLNLHQSILTGKTSKNSYTICIVTKDVQEKYVTINSTLIKWDNKPAVLVLLTDITKLNKAESDLKLSKERYELAAMGSATGIWDWDIIANKLYISTGLKKLIGYESDEVDISMDVFFNLLHPEDVDRVQLGLEKHLKEHLDYNVDYRLQTKSGKYHWFHARGQLLRDKTGEAARMSGSITDISKRKKAESDLKISEERYELAIEGSDAGIWDYNIESSEIYYSNHFNGMLGYKPQEMQDTVESAFNRIHPDHREKAILALSQHLDRKTAYYSNAYLGQTKSGEYRWFQARGKAVWDENGKATRIAGSFIDIHEQKEAEEKILRSESRFRQLVEQSPLTPDGKINLVNTAWKKLWKVSDEEAAETVEKYNMLTDPQIEKLGIMEEVKKAFKGGHVILPPIQYDTGETKNDFDIKQLKNFRSPWIQCHLNAVKDANGTLDYVVNTYVDITDLKEAEEKTKKLRELIVRLDRTSSMGQLTGSIAHELNQPLTGILSNAQAAELILQNRNSDMEEIKEILAEIVSDTKRAGDVIRNLRDLYGEHKIELLPVELNIVVQEAVKLLHGEFVAKRINITTKYVDANLMLKGNKVQIQQVVFNLIMNAIEAMFDNDHDERNIWVTTSYKKNEVKVCVVDSGKGISPEIIDNIFEPLATWKPGGTGMGLAISNSIITSHGGRMAAENQPEGGANVCFILPGTKIIK